MSAIEITITGVLYDKINRTSQPVVLIGEASLTGLGVGGGPIIPPPFDPNAPRPSHPIAKPGDPWWGQDLHPEHPIVIPPSPIDPPINLPPGGTPMPPAVGVPIPGWAVWVPTKGWTFVPATGAIPKPPTGGGPSDPNAPHPEHPIEMPGDEPHPEHPIVLPDDKKKK